MKKTILIGGAMCMMLITHTVFGADIFFSGTKTAIDDQTTFYADVRISASEGTNAVQGKIRIPDGVHILEITTGSSVVSLWPEPPVLVNGIISFSGLIPGGYDGNSGNLFSLSFTAAHDARLTFDSAELLANDGQGTVLPTKVAESALFADFSSASNPPERDVTPPETFVPTIVHEPGLFEGKYALIFSTTDKGVGMDHYEVMEFKSGSPEGPQWKQAESPYVLNDQSLASDIYVRAVDRSGNFLVIEVSKASQQAPRNYFLILSGTVVLLLVIWIAKRRARFIAGS